MFPRKTINPSNRRYNSPLSRLRIPLQSAATASAPFSGFLDAEGRHRPLSPSSVSSHRRMQQKRRVSRDCIARCEPRNCSCGTAELCGIRTNGIHPGSLIRPSRATYNYMSTVKPARFPREHARARTHTHTHTHTFYLFLSPPLFQGKLINSRLHFSLATLTSFVLSSRKRNLVIVSRIRH